MGAFASRGHLLSPATGERLADAVDLLSRIRRHEDAGLWELGGCAHYGTSKLGCLVAIERLPQRVAHQSGSAAIYKPPAAMAWTAGCCWQPGAASPTRWVLA